MKTDIDNNHLSSVRENNFHIRMLVHDFNADCFLRNAIRGKAIGVEEVSNI